MAWEYAEIYCDKALCTSKSLHSRGSVDSNIEASRSKSHLSTLLIQFYSHLLLPATARAGYYSNSIAMLKLRP